MRELLVDAWGLIAAVLTSGWEILRSGLSLVVIDDPFWRGVELTIAALLVWRHRKALIAAVDSVPLLGGLVAKGLTFADDATEGALELADAAWAKLRSSTWDKLVARVKRADEDLRE